MRIDAMLRGFMLVNVDHWDVVAVETRELRIAVNIDFAKFGVKFREERLDDRLRVIAEAAPRPRIKGYLQGHGLGCENFWNGPAWG